MVRRPRERHPIAAAGSGILNFRLVVGLPTVAVSEAFQLWG